MQFWIAQIFGLLGLMAMVYGLFQKKKKVMLRYVVYNGLFFSVEYLLLGALSGMWSNLFGVCRTFICSQKETDARLDNFVVLATLMGVYLFIGISSYDGLASILPIIAEEIYIISIWQHDERIIRCGTAVMVIFWFIYDLIMAAYPSAICDLIVFSSALISLFVNKKHK